MTSFDAVLDYVTAHANALNMYSLAIGLRPGTVAAVIGEEYRTYNTSLIPFKDSILDGEAVGIVQAATVLGVDPQTFLESRYQADYSTIIQGQSIPKTASLTDPLGADVGAGNINFGQTIRLLKRYYTQFPSSDPLGLNGYKSDYLSLLRDMIDLSKDAEIKIGALFVRDATDFYQTDPQAANLFNNSSLRDQDNLIDFRFRNSATTVLSAIHHGSIDNNRDGRLSYFYAPTSPYNAAIGILSGSRLPQSKTWVQVSQGNKIATIWSALREFTANKFSDHTGYATLDAQGNLSYHIDGIADGTIVNFLTNGTGKSWTIGVNADSTVVTGPTWTLDIITVTASRPSNGVIPRRPETITLPTGGVLIKNDDIEGAIRYFVQPGDGSDLSSVSTSSTPESFRSSLPAAPQIASITASPDGPDRLLADIGPTLGGLFGATLGRILGGTSPFLSSLSGELLGALTQKVSTQLLSGSLDSAIDLSKVVSGDVRDIFAGANPLLPGAIASAGIGTASSFLTAELANALGLNGTTGEIFGVVGNSVLSIALNNVGANLAPLAGFNFSHALGLKTISFTGPLNNVPSQPPVASAGLALVGSALGQYFGTKLAEEIVQPNTEAVAIFASLHAAFTAANGFTAGFTAGFAIGGPVGGFIGGVIGATINAFVSTVIDTLFGNLFGHKKENIPLATAEADLNPTSGLYFVGLMNQQYGGDIQIVRDMAQTAANTLNSFVGISGGQVISDPSVSYQIYGDRRGQLYVTYRGQENDVTSADNAVEWGVLHTIHDLTIAGGDIYIKRALANSTATTISALGGDLTVVSDYENYLANTGGINDAIKLSPDSTYAAGWLVTLQRADELGLDQWNKSDFNGGLKGFLDSFDLAGAGAHYEDTQVSTDGYGLGLDYSNYRPVFSSISSSLYNGSFVYIPGFAGLMGLHTGYQSYTQGNYLGFAGYGSGQNVNLKDNYYTAYNNIVIGSPWDDTIQGGLGNDWIDGGTGGNDLITAGSGNDVILVHAGSNTIQAGSGSDYIAMGIGWDTVIGGAGDETVVGGAGPGLGVAYGGSGNNTFIANEQGVWDYFVGGSGSNTISFDRFDHGMFIDMRVRNVPWDGNASEFFYGPNNQVTVSNVQNVIGTHYADSIFAPTNGPASIQGQGANDTIVAGSGQDTLEGGPGTIFYGTTNNTTTISYAHSDAGVYVDLGTGTLYGGEAEGQVDYYGHNLIGSKFNDVLGADQQAGSTLSGGAGDDTYIGNWGGHTYIGGDGFNTVDFSNSQYAVGLWLGNNSATSQYDGYGWAGMAVNSTFHKIEAVIGSSYNDDLQGGDGDQTFYMGAGTSTIHGHGWYNNLVGSNTYVYNLSTNLTGQSGFGTVGANPQGGDLIYDNNSGSDTLRLGSGISYNNLWFGLSNNNLYVGLTDKQSYVEFVGDTSNQPNDILRTIDMGGASHLDVGFDGYITQSTTQFLSGLSGHGNLLRAYADRTVIESTGLQLTRNHSTEIIGATNATIYTSGGGDEIAFERGDGQYTVYDYGGGTTLVCGSTVAADDVIYQVLDTSAQTGTQSADLYIGLRDLNNPTYTANMVTDYVKVVGGGVISNGALSTIQYVEAGGTTVDLSKANIPWIDITPQNYCPNGYDPIVLDLDGSGAELSSVSNSGIVVKNAQGVLTRTGWVGPTNGILVMDRKGDGQVNTLADMSFLQDSPGAKTDSQGLAAYDVGARGFLDATDPIWSKLQVWVDRNQDGHADPGEVMTLDQLGITSINLKGTPTGYDPKTTFDSYITNTLSFTRADGTSGDAFDVVLARRMLTALGPEATSNLSWATVGTDGTLGRLLNDPRTAALLAETGTVTASPAAQAAVPGIASAAGTASLVATDPIRVAPIATPLTYAQVSALAQTDFSGGAPINAAAAALWADRLDPTAIQARATALQGNGGINTLSGLQGLISTTSQPTGRGVKSTERQLLTLVIDMNGQGLKLNDPTGSGVQDDADSIGLPEQIGWVGAGMAMLALDVGATGTIDIRTGASFAGDKVGAKTALQNLSVFDSNGDGALTASDARFGNFVVWTDANHAGKSDPSAVQTLAQAGVASISLKPTSIVPDKGDLAANQVLGQAVVTLTDGTTRIGYDVALGVIDPLAATTPTTTTTPTAAAPAAPATLPDLASSGAAAVSPPTDASQAAPLGASASAVSGPVGVTASRLGEDGPTDVASTGDTVTAGLDALEGWWRSVLQTAGGQPGSVRLSDFSGPTTLAGSTDPIMAPSSIVTDAAALQRQQLLRQSMASFTGDVGGSAAVWSHAAVDPGLAALSAANTQAPLSSSAPVLTH